MQNNTNNTFIALFAGLVFIAPVHANTIPVPAGSSVTIRQCYDWAREQNEDLKIRLETIEQARLKARASIGDVYPNISWNYDHTWQQPSGVEELERKGFSGFVEKRQAESRFTVEQPIFSGLREFSALSGFKREKARDEFLLQWATEELIEKTAIAFYMVMNIESDRMNTIATYDLAQDRVKELRGFLRLGKARDSEVFTAKAYSAGLKARLDRIQAARVSAREQLSFLTGHDLRTAPLVDTIPDPVLFEPLDPVLARARNRADIRAQQEEMEALKLRVRYEKGFYWPTADLTGNYYTQRATFLEDIDWDVLLSVGVPLYQGGVISANVKQALSAYRQAQWELQRMERNIDYVVRRTHGELTAAFQEAASLEEATDAAEQSYKSLHEEYRLGLVTNLDVLQSLDFLQNQKSDRDAIRWKVRRLWIQLNVVSGNPL